MIKRYHAQTVLSDYGNDHGLKTIVESEDGEFYKIEDVEWLFKERFQINKLNLKQGDIIVTRPPEGIKWKLEHAKQIHELFKQLLENCGYHIGNITFREDVNLGIISTDKSANGANGE
jgi:hypothetical protein